MSLTGFLVSAGLEWHPGNKKENRSLDLALITVARRSPASEYFLEPKVRLRYSTLASPFLLAGLLDVACVFQISPLAGPTAKKLHSLELSPSLSALCALSSALASKVSLGQSFSFGLVPASALFWTGELEMGMYMPAGQTLLYAGVRLNLGEGTASKGEAVFSFAL